MGFRTTFVLRTMIAVAMLGVGCSDDDSDGDSGNVCPSGLVREADRCVLPQSAGILGCTDSNASNYDSRATWNDGSCTYAVSLGVDVSGFDAFVAADGVQVTGELSGTLDDDGDGTWSGTLVVKPGVYLYAFANGDTVETVPDDCDNGENSRTLSVGTVPTSVPTVPFNACPSVSGCTDEDAVNFDPAVLSDDGSCQYAVTFTVDLVGRQDAGGSPDETPVDGVSVEVFTASGDNVSGALAQTSDGATSYIGTLTLDSGLYSYRFRVGDDTGENTSVRRVEVSDGPLSVDGGDFVSIEAELPMVVSEHFGPSGFFGSAGDVTLAVNTDCDLRPTNAAGDCYRFDYRESGETEEEVPFAGVTWLNGPAFTEQTPRPVEAGAAQLTFFAWTDDDEEAVTFGYNVADGGPGDSAVVTLTSTPQQFVVPITDVYTTVEQGFSWSAARLASDPTLTFFVTDVVWRAPPAGCTDSTAVNFDPIAVTDDGSCAYPVTFLADLSAEADPSPSAGVFVELFDDSGSEPDLILVEGDTGIYSATLDLPAGVYSYRLRIGDAGGQDTPVRRFEVVESATTVDSGLFAEIAAAIPMVVSENYGPGGIFGSSGDVTLTVNTDCTLRPEDARGDCYHFVYDEQGEPDLFAGAIFLNGTGFEDDVGRLVDPGATQLTFYAWGTSGDERLAFGFNTAAGGDSGEPSEPNRTTEITLTTTPTRYTFDINRIYDDRIRFPFLWSQGQAAVDPVLDFFVTDIVWQVSDPAPPTALSAPVVVDTVFPGRAEFGTGGPALHIETNECPMRAAPAERSPVGDCHRMVYDPGATAPGFTGAFWVSGTGFDDAASVPIEAGVDAVSFFAWGGSGGEVVEFGFGFERDAAILRQTQTLNDVPTQYTIDLSGVDYRAVVGGFQFAIRSEDNSDAAVELFIDDVQYLDNDGGGETEGPAGCTDSDAENFDPGAVTDDGSCTFVMVTLPYIVSNDFAPNGAFGAFTSVDCETEERPDGARGECYGFSYDTGSVDGSTGTIWLRGPSFDDNGVVQIEGGATSVSFYAWGESGGEEANFETKRDAPAPVFSVTTGRQTLTDVPMKYSIDVSSTGYETDPMRFPLIWIGFGAGTIYIDDIVWE
ncbi:MAG: hypothetical protein AAF735_00325 [Myxococcota bacterium]